MSIYFGKNRFKVSHDVWLYQDKIYRKMKNNGKFLIRFLRGDSYANIH